MLDRRRLGRRIWHSGAGPAVGSGGSIFVITGNGSFGPEKADFAESIVQLTLRTGASAGLTVASWWTPWTDSGRSGGDPEGEEGAPLPSNVVKTTLLGHALRMGIGMRGMAPMDVDDVSTGSDAAEATIAELMDSHMDSMSGSVWDDQDFGSGGPVYTQAARAILAAGKDGVLYTVNPAALGNTEPAGLALGNVAVNYAKLLSSDL